MCLRGALAGLILVDFEFEDEESMRAFDPPEGMVDVTEVEAIAGGMLAGRTYKEVSAAIDDYSAKMA